MSKEFVYVLSNPSMPGLVKVGFSTKVPHERAEELATTGVPLPFEVEYYCLVDEPAALEASVHQAMREMRQACDREFFRASAAEAIACIERLARAVEHFWNRTPAAPRAPRASNVPNAVRTTSRRRPVRSAASR